MGGMSITQHKAAEQGNRGKLTTVLALEGAMGHSKFEHAHL
jgi:hypothetical protein